MSSEVNSNKLVSVIIPFFNRLDLLQESIKSVTEQTYKPIELILVDDNSNEEYDKDIFDKYSKNGITTRLIRNKNNLGPGLSREAGRLESKGEYIAYLDSDDFWNKDFLKKLIGYLELYPEVGMAYSKTLLLRNTGNFLRNKNDQNFDKIIPVIFDVHGRPWATGACVWKKNVAEKIGSWSNSRIWEDYEYDVRAAIINNQIIHIPEVLFYVNMDSKGKISLFKNTKEMNIDKSKSILSISKHLRKSKFFNEQDIKRRITYFLLTSCATLSDYKAERRKILDIYNEFCRWKGGLLMSFDLLILMFPYSLNARMFRKLRDYFR